MKQGLYSVEVQGRELRVFLDTAKLNLSAPQLVQLGRTMRDLAVAVHHRASMNVSGRTVVYEGRVFRVIPRTNALRASIDWQWPYMSPLQARVFVNGAHTASPFQIGGYYAKPRPVLAYAAAIEYGHGPIDLKKTMMGKTVPFFASRTANSKGPYAARGLVERDDGLWENAELNAKLASQGKQAMLFQRHQTRRPYSGDVLGAHKGSGSGSSYYIAFRKVGKKGWIIPAARERPFMRAAVRQSEKDARSLIYNGLKVLLADAAARH